MNTKQFILSSRPKGTPRLDNFKLEEIDLPEIKEDEVLLKSLYYSVDPYMRGRMNDAKSYVPPFLLNQAIEGGVIAKVIESKTNKFIKGDIVAGMLPWREQTITQEKGLQKIDPSIAPISYHLDILGMTGLTAYFGLIHIGKPKAGETVVVSAAAGAVGLVVGQIAKIKGCRVIGIAGSDEKIKLLKEKYGFDEAINYKTVANLSDAIAEAAPKGVDIYFDGVGGKISDAVISNINFNARIPLCGQISLYNTTEIPMGPRLQPMLLTRSVLMQGFIVGNYKNDFPEGIKQLTQWVKENKLKFTETIIKGFDKLPEALLGLFKGENTGKMIVEA
ncbi:MAG: NADP-dependent oxidoreductase [Bacteroidia bacterium]